MTPTPRDTPSKTTRQLLDYPEALDEPRPEGTPSKTALRMAGLLRSGCKEG